MDLSELRFPNKSHRKPILLPCNSPRLAELMGAYFGDGNIANRWQLNFSMNAVKDSAYAYYITSLVFDLFQIRPKIRKRKDENTLAISCSSISLVDYFITKGAIPGNKIHYQPSIPNWIHESSEYEKLFVRGLIDTDGCLYIHRHKVGPKEYKNIGFCFTNLCLNIVQGVADILAHNNIKPYITKDKRNIYLYRVASIERYLEVFGSSNPRIIKVYNQWRDVRAA